jgi:DNA (cytosine-5)-methyltransferase 1
MAVYYNEIDPAAAHILQALIKKGVIADGVVDRRSISEVQPDEIREFKQCHFFAGGGLWSVALRLAGYADDRSIWTGSCPCQPFSVAGKGAGKDDKRHLWPDFFRLIEGCRPAIVMGEQVSGSAGYDWFDGVASDLERGGYKARAVDIPALAVGAAHIRQRLYWIGVGDTVSARLERHSWNVPGRDKSGRLGEIKSGSTTAPSNCCDMADANPIGCDGIGNSQCAGIESSCGREFIRHGEDGIVYRQGNLANTDSSGWREHSAGRNINDGQNAEWKKTASDNEFSSAWDDAEWFTGCDGKARRVKPGIRLLADGIPGRVHLLRLGGNAIVPPLAAQVIKAMMESEEIFFVESDC